MRKTRSLILLILLSFTLFQSPKAEASISVGKEYHYLWSNYTNFTYEGQSVYYSRFSTYFLEILSIIDDEIGIKQGYSQNFMYYTESLVSEGEHTYLYPDVYYQPYFVNKADMEFFYEYYMAECSERIHATDFSAEKRVFTYSEMNPSYLKQIGVNVTDSGDYEPIYETGTYYREVMFEYSKDGVLKQVVDCVSFIGEIAEYYDEEELFLTDVKVGSNTSFILISCSLLFLVPFYWIKRRRRRND